MLFDVSERKTKKHCKWVLAQKIQIRKSLIFVANIFKEHKLTTYYDYMLKR